MKNKLIKTLNTLLTSIVCLMVLNTPSHAFNTTTYYHHDGLGSPVAATDEAGNLKWREDYQPYGERVRKPTNADNNLWYTGKPEEPALGLQYFGARWYDPALGRFTGIDPVPFQENNIHSFNRYAYANNNPYGYVDPDGRRAVGTARTIDQVLSGAGPYSHWGPSYIGGPQGLRMQNGTFLTLSGKVVHVRDGAIFLEPGRISFIPKGQSTKKGVSKFQGLEVRAQRSLSHVGEGTLKAMQKHGFAAKDAKGNKLILHHHKQNPNGPIIQIPAKNHSIGNSKQHPKGNQKGAGLTQQQRDDFNQWRKDYWKDQATQELKNRGL